VCGGVKLEFTGKTVSPNNLGGLGPDLDDVDNQVIRFIEIDSVEEANGGSTVGLYDLILANTTEYKSNEETFTDGVSQGSLLNGVEGAFGQVNVQQGHSLGVEACFVYSGTDDYATLPLFYLTFYDIDQGVGPSGITEYYHESLTMGDNYHAYFVNVDGQNITEHPNEPGTQCTFADVNQNGASLFKSGTSVDGSPAYLGDVDWDKTAVQDAVCPTYGGGDGDSFYANYPCTEIAITFTSNNELVATSSGRGFGCDNPKDDPSELNDVQRARSVMFEFKEQSCLEMTFGSLGDVQFNSGRNFQFAGSSFECECEATE